MNHVVAVMLDPDPHKARLGLWKVACSCGWVVRYSNRNDGVMVARAHWAEYDGGRTQSSNRTDRKGE